MERHHPLRDQTIEHGLPDLGIVQHVLRNIAPELLAQTLLLLPQGIFQFRLGNLDIAHLGDDVHTTRIIDKGLDAEEGKWQRDQHQKNLDDFAVFLYEFKHASSRRQSDIKAMPTNRVMVINRRL